MPSFHPSRPRAIPVDKNTAVITGLKKEKKMPLGILNPADKIFKCIVELDNHFIQKRILSMLSLRSFRTAISILTEVEAMHMIKKNRLMYGISLFQTKNNSFISSLD